MVYHCTNSILLHIFNLSLQILCVTAHYFMPCRPELWGRRGHLHWTHRGIPLRWTGKYTSWWGSYILPFYDWQRSLLRRRQTEQKTTDMKLSVIIIIIVIRIITSCPLVQTSPQEGPFMHFRGSIVAAEVNVLKVDRKIACYLDLEENDIGPVSFVPGFTSCNFTKWATAWLHIVVRQCAAV